MPHCSMNVSVACLAGDRGSQVPGHGPDQESRRPHHVDEDPQSGRVRCGGEDGGVVGWGVYAWVPVTP